MKNLILSVVGLVTAVHLSSADITEYRNTIISHVGTVAHWTLDGHFEDSVGGHHGEQRGNVSFTEGVGGTQGIFLTGNSAQDHVHVNAGQPDLQASIDSEFTTDSMTVLVWAVRTFENDWDTVIERNKCWYIAPENQDFVGRIYGPQNPGGGGTPQVRTSGACVAGELYFMAMTYDFDSAFFRTYLNGELLEEVDYLDGIPPVAGVSGTINEGGDIAIGTWRNHDPADNHAGMIDEASYLSVSLTPEEIAALYQMMSTVTSVDTWEVFE